MFAVAAELAESECGRDIDMGSGVMFSELKMLAGSITKGVCVVEEYRIPGKDPEARRPRLSTLPSRLLMRSRISVKVLSFLNRGQQKQNNGR